MPRIRLLVSVGAERGVRGDAGTELEVDNPTARAWCDGERAERVIDREVPVEHATATPPQAASVVPSGAPDTAAGPAPRMTAAARRRGGR